MSSKSKSDGRKKTERRQSKSSLMKSAKPARIRPNKKRKGARDDGMLASANKRKLPSDKRRLKGPRLMPRGSTRKKTLRRRRESTQTASWTSTLVSAWLVFCKRPLPKA